MIRNSLLLVLLLAAATVCRAQDAATQLVEIAKTYYDQEQYEQAKTHLVDTVLKDDGVLANGALLERADSLLNVVLTRLEDQQKLVDSVKTLIFYARKDSAEGRPLAACDSLERALTVASDNADLKKQARALFLKQQCEVSTTLLAQRRYAPWALTILDVLLVIPVLLGLYWGLRFGRWVYTLFFGRRWLFESIEDTSELGLGDEVTSTLFHWFRQHPDVSAGLLRLEPMAQPKGFELSIPGPSLNLDLGSLPTLGGIQVNIVAKIIKAVSTWIKGARPWIRGTVLASDSIVKVVLTSKSRKGIPHSTTASCVKDAKPCELTAIIESATFQMYFLIAKDASAAEAESADSLRIGAKHLQTYIAGQDHQQLEEAYSSFRSARVASPQSTKAYLNEGVALDLMERHDEAIHLFALAREMENCGKEKKMSELCQKAIYNEAVAKFRKYQPEALKEAIKLLDDHLIGDDKTGLELYPLARIARVNFVAHKPIFWQHLCHGNKSKDENEVRIRREQSRSEVWVWVLNVETETETLDQAIKDGEITSDPNTLRWSIWNARGNAYLNYSNNFEREAPEPGRDLLHEALAYFEKCEVLFPNTVETLTNLATTYLNLGEYERCRDYCDLALTINPAYEYAAYRKCQSWLRENKLKKLLKCLEETKTAFDQLPNISKFPKIPGFEAIYDEYYE